MKRLIITSMITLFILTATSCSQSITINKSIASEANRVTYEEFNEAFHQEYGLNHLLSHEIYFDGENVQAEFYFSSKATDGEIDAAYLFAVNKFIYHKYNNLNPGYYDDYMLENLVDINQKNLFFLVYTDGKIKKYEIYDASGKLLTKPIE